MNRFPAARILLVAALAAAPAAPVSAARPSSKALSRAASEGDPARAAEALDAGAAIDEPYGLSKPYSGWTPLASAAYYGHEEVVRLLIERGADLNASRGRGYMPLAAAAMGGQARIAELLLEKGANPDQAAARLERNPDAENRSGLSLLNRLAARAQASGAGVSKDELARIVQQAVSQGAARSPAQGAEAPAGPAFQSDVDAPAYKLPERPSDFAVVVGIEKYSDIPDAQFAQRDAEAVLRHLLALGLPSRNVVLLAGEKAGYKSIEKFVEAWLPRNAGPQSRVYFFFSGHGAPDPATGEAYLLPWDGDPNFLENTGYPLKRLYGKLGALKAREVVVALDACFSGAGGRSVLPKGARPLVTKVEPLPAASKKLTIFAAASGEQITSTREDQGHGAFTYHFLKGLSGGAADSAKTVTARGLHEYLGPKVADDARRQNREQTPLLQGGASALELARFR